MNCRDLKARLDQYARHALAPEETAALEAHLTRCPLCSAMLESLEPRLPEVASLPRSVDPPAEVWSGVESRLVPRGRIASRRLNVPAWMLTAAAVLLVAVSAGVTALLLQPGRDAETSRRRDGGTPSRLATVDFEAQYASATEELAAELGKAKSRLDPATFAVIERNLRVIDSALVESRRALASDPGNQVLEQMVVAVWRQKMDFLRRATALSPAL
jgi:hypothetical protein